MPNEPSLAALISRLLDWLQSGELHRGFDGALTRGSAQGTVSVAPTERSETRLLRVALDIMRSPTEESHLLWKRLLEMNAELKGRAAFLLRSDGMVCLEAGRPLDELDAGELIDLIVWTADKADDLDDVLLDEFGRELAP